jgi:hypothetical protein
MMEKKEKKKSNWKFKKASSGLGDLFHHTVVWYTIFEIMTYICPLLQPLFRFWMGFIGRRESTRSRAGVWFSYSASCNPSHHRPFFLFIVVWWSLLALIQVMEADIWPSETSEGKVYELESGKSPLDWKVWVCIRWSWSFLFQFRVLPEMVIFWIIKTHFTILPFLDYHL